MPNIKSDTDYIEVSLRIQNVLREQECILSDHQSDSVLGIIEHYMEIEYNKGYKQGIFDSEKLLLSILKKNSF